jgi:hypothetical protein
MPEEKRRSDFEDLAFPFQEYLEDLEYQEDFLVQETEDRDIPKILVGTFVEKFTILKETIKEIKENGRYSKKIYDSARFFVLKFSYTFLYALSI